VSGIPADPVKGPRAGVEAEWRGVIAGAILPFDTTGAIDWESFERHLEGLAAAPLAGVVVNADTGEGPHLLPRERDDVLEFAARVVAGRMPVLSGLVARTAAEGVQAARRAEEAGAAGLQVFQPFEVAADGAPGYYEALGEACLLPLVVYQPPAALGAGLEEDMLRSVVALEPVAGVKESSWDRRRFARCADLCRRSRTPTLLLSGADSFILESLRMGADGTMLAVAALDPDVYVELFRRRETEAAEVLQRALDPFLELLLAPPVADFRARLKELLRRDGIIRSAAVREPLRPIGRAEAERLAYALATCREAVASTAGAGGEHRP
jgi:4-hydroxy-tetrahydrodipicolinate synthase